MVTGPRFIIQYLSDYGWADLPGDFSNREFAQELATMKMYELTKQDGKIRETRVTEVHI